MKDLYFVSGDLSLYYEKKYLICTLHPEIYEKKVTFSITIGMHPF